MEINSDEYDQEFIILLAGMNNKYIKFILPKRNRNLYERYG